MTIIAESVRVSGTVKWFSQKKGFGFVAPDRGDEDVFMHHSALPESVGGLRPGDRITFELGQGKKGPIATDVMPFHGDVQRPQGEALAAGFGDLALNAALLRALADSGYERPTPIQAQAIPHVLAGRDVLGCAQTGTGKTAAFVLPILQRLAEASYSAGQPVAPSGSDNKGRKGKRRPGRPVRALILSPTRELALQIGDSANRYGRYMGLKHTVVYGGTSQNPQVDALRRGTDVLIATPGRLLDLMQQGHADLRHVEVVVLDEADRMLDMGFIRDVKRILQSTPTRRQTLLFSATLPAEIVELSASILSDPQEISVTPEQPTVDAIEQAVYQVPRKGKQALLERVLEDKSLTRVLVFTRTKHGANRVVKNLARANIQAEAIHGNKSQTARQRALKNFQKGATRVLVATDVVSRGIDVEQVSHVIQFDLPHEPETYVHRIGRTGRAGAAGIALAFCAEEERPLLKDIERLIRMKIARKQV